MEFCLGCGSDLPSESRYVRRLVAERSDLSRLRSGVVLAWRNLMKEALEENSGPSLCSLFPDIDKPGKMCKSCYKVYDTLSRKCTKLRSKLSVVASRITPVPTPPAATPRTPSRKRLSSAANVIAQHKKQLCQDSGSPSVQVNSECCHL